jgi:type II secretory pathway pseudopilin PulG
MASILGFVVGLVSIAAIGASTWVFMQTQRDIVRMSQQIAEIKLSLELFGRQQAPVADQTGSVGSAELLDLSNRIAILEENWRSAAAVPAPAPSSSLPPLPSEAGDNAAPVATGGDCLPTGTRFMVASGDSYPVCGTSGVLEIGSVDNGFMTLADGTVIAQGGTVGLPGTRCMVGMVPSDGGTISGFAEIRVTC